MGLIGLALVRKIFISGSLYSGRPVPARRLSFVGDSVVSRQYRHVLLFCENCLLRSSL
jgi:hypothetical protein